MVDKPLIKKKLAELDTYLKKLRALQSYELKDLTDNIEKAWAAEHGLQLAVQVLLDIGNHILAARGINKIEDYGDIFLELGKEGILDPEFASSIRGMVGFRNILIHEYTRVDLEKVLDILKNHLEDFTSFASQVSDYIKRI